MQQQQWYTTKAEKNELVTNLAFNVLCNDRPAVSCNDFIVLIKYNQRWNTLHYHKDIVPYGKKITQNTINK